MYPAMPPVDVPPTPPRPKAVDTAVQLTIAGTVVGSVGGVISAFDEELVASIVRQAAPDGTPDQIELLTRAVPIAGVLGVALTLGVFVLIALKVRAGRNWARALLAGLTAFSLISFLSAAARTNAELSLMWSLADVACCTAAVVYLFGRESSEYFRAHMRKPR
ncbi:hypothetical protein ACFQV2_36280 [Actinokineospora soli]|uniref:Integral membrane protein n=1 Tax=Actinokineospora soli TaxID=1048753 RepID=A0ABW2TXJ7_9PSEU